MKTEHDEQLLKFGEIIFTKCSKKILYFCSFCCNENLDTFSTEILKDFIQHISDYHFDKTFGTLDHHHMETHSNFNYDQPLKNIKYFEDYVQNSSHNPKDIPNYQSMQFFESHQSLNSSDTSIAKMNDKNNNNNNFYQSTNNISGSWPTHSGNENDYEITDPNQNLIKQEIIEVEIERIQTPSLIAIEKPYKCEYCGKYFTQSQNLTVHKRIHTGEKPFKCDICLKNFSHKSNLNVHRKIHDVGREKNKNEQNKSLQKTSDTKYLENNRLKLKSRIFKCVYCQKSFAQNHNLLIHIRSHTGEKPYNCELCEKSFSHKSNLKVHLRTHTGEKPFQCKQCNKKYTDNSSLIYHQKTHFHGIRYKCLHCKKQFAAKKDLNQHENLHLNLLQQNLPLNLKPHKCKDCNKSFANASNLSIHKRIHSGVKPYKCKVCDKPFRHNSNLIVHQRIH